MPKNLDKLDKINNFSDLELSVRHSKDEILPDPKSLQIALSKISLAKDVTKSPEKAYKFGENAKRFFATFKSAAWIPITAIVLAIAVAVSIPYLSNKPQVNISNKMRDRIAEPSKLTLLKDSANSGKKVRAPQLSKPISAPRTAPRHVGRNI